LNDPIHKAETMRIPLDRQSKLPLYKQIDAYIRASIQSGSLPPDTRLPAARQLAADLGVNRITVENAYAELEADGLVYSRVGSGTYVLPPGPLQPLLQDAQGGSWPQWQQPASPDGLEPWKTAAVGMLPTSPDAGLLDFSGGIGDHRRFPVEDFRKVIQSVLRDDGAASLGYGDYRGYAPLRVTIAHVLASQGIQARPDNILITAGSQQALTLVAQLLLQPGDTVLVENPTYSGALELFRALRLRVVGIPMDERGMQVDGLEALLREFQPKMIYTIPNFHNPTGACLSGQRRRQLVALADRYNIPVLEDDYVGDLRYEGRALPALKALDPGGRVVYVSTFSKMLMPGLRVGFLVVEGPVYDRLVRLKHASDLATSSLVQRALQAYVTVGRYQAHLRRSAQLYRRRRDAMLLAIHRDLMPEGAGLSLPAEVRLHPPQGGFFIWLRLPGGLSSEELLPLACQEGMAFAPGGLFFPEGAGGCDCLRLNFAAHSPQEIEEGIRRLGRALKRLESCKRPNFDDT